MERNEEALPLDGALGFLRWLWRLNHAMEALSLRMERGLGITAQQRLLIRCLGKFPGITPGRLAELLCVDPGTVSSTTRRLLDRGLIRRETGDSDRRRVALGLSPAGRQIDQPSPGTVECAVENLLASTSERDIETTVRVLKRLVTYLDSETPRIPVTKRSARSR
jgi:DNA-binding MarR family transcriptional regulator